MKRLLYFLFVILLLPSCAVWADEDFFLEAPETGFGNNDTYYSIEDSVSGLHLDIYTVGTLGEIIQSPEWIQKAREEMYEKAPDLIHVYDVTYNGGRYIFLLNTMSNVVSGRKSIRLYQLDGEEVSMANINGEELSGQVRISPREKGR